MSTTKATLLKPFLNATFLYAGVMCPMMFWNHTAWAAMPFLCVWLGALLRVVWPNPAKWIKALMLISIPVMYLCLVFIPFSFRVNPGQEMKMVAMIIIGFLTLPVAARYIHWKMWIRILFILLLVASYAASKCSVDWTCSILPEQHTEWTKLFFRIIKNVRIAAASFFFLIICFHPVLQTLCSQKWFRWTVLVVAIASWFYICFFRRPLMFNYRYDLPYMIIVHPATALIVVCLIKGVKPVFNTVLPRATQQQ